MIKRSTGILFVGAVCVLGLGAYGYVTMDDESASLSVVSASSGLAQSEIQQNQSHYSQISLQNVDQLRLISIEDSPFSSARKALLLFKNQHFSVQVGQRVSPQLSVLEIRKTEVLLDFQGEKRLIQLEKSTTAAASLPPLTLQGKLAEYGGKLEVINQDDNPLLLQLGLAKGDQITHVNGQLVHSEKDLEAQLKHVPADGIVHLKGLRNNQVVTWVIPFS
jgi:hypothetical protein